MKKERLKLNGQLSEEIWQFVNNNPEVDKAFCSQLDDWEKSTEFKLRKDFPFTLSEAQCSSSERQVDLGQSDITSYKLDLQNFDSFLSEAKLPRDITYWQQAISGPENKVAGVNVDSTDQVSLTVRKLLLQNWRKMLDQKRAEWELETINYYREIYLRQLNDWLEAVKKIVDSINGLGLEPGYFLDFSKGQLSLSDINQVKKWAAYLADDKGVRALCELLGKMQQVSLSEKVELAKTVVSIPVTIPQVDSREEITGIRAGRDIEYLLASELALLADDETSVLFDLKYIESRLMCFDMQGLQTDLAETEIEIEQQVKEEEQKGPMIICVDTSGSMHGSPETIAKAVTMYLASHARQQKRACYLINFSTDIEVLDLSASDRLQTLLTFLSRSFHGGTDAAPAIAHGLKVMESDDYADADMLIISDFVMSTLPHPLLSSIEKQRVCGNKFYSLCIGNHFLSKQLRSHFDREWIYSSANSNICELTGFQNSVINRKSG